MRQKENPAALLPVAEALERVLAGVEPLPAQSVPLADALGSVLAEDLAALRTQPPAAVSAMDGYAVRASDVSHAPVELKVIGEVAAGHPFSSEIGPGQAARIFTGGVMPGGSDTVVIQENTTRNGKTVTVRSVTTAGRYVRPEGIDFKKGQMLLAKGRRLTDRDLMLAAAMNYPALKVHRAPLVAILGTGDELVPPGSTPKPGQIIYSNSYALAALARREGALIFELDVARDSVAELTGKIRRARDADADVLLVSGGASVGDHDLVQKALTSEGLDLSFWRIAMRPGRPMMHGRLGPMHVLGVPGNPVSSYVCSFLFLVPLLRRLAGRSDLHPQPLAARLGCDLKENDERADYLRATVTTMPDGTLVATPVENQDSSLMASLAKADCLLICEPHSPAAKAGSACVILKLGL
ncbi:MAG: molybdopterin molybdotransferase MoeA [Pseudolabrys sp.]